MYKPPISIAVTMSQCSFPKPPFLYSIDLPVAERITHKQTAYTLLSYMDRIITL